ncbi:MAG TPA: TIGR03620 family F420-dependent LLM class oxidoreductase [Trebonia sp.]|jgi:probable F420-dependent oxidoreductase|nr:TIGR03620 family F420-dependent LLM class oxidoreductase [Trebonia sp.]
MKSPLHAMLPRFAVSTGDLDHLNYQDGQRYVADLENTGFGMLWLSEVLGREAFTSAQLALAATANMVIGSGVVRAFERVPKSAAAAQATLVDGFPGRYVMGLGVNAIVRERGQTPAGFMSDYLDQIDEYHGRRGVRREDAPRVLGAYSPVLTKLAAARTDGLITFLVTPEHTAWAREAIGPDSFLSVSQWVIVDSDPGSARELARRQLAYYLKLPHQINKLRRLRFSDDDLAEPGSDKLIDAVVSHGAPDDIAASLDRHRSAGADQVVLGVLGPPTAAKVRQYRLLASALGI